MVVGAGGRSRAGWNGTIDDMVSYGLSISPEDRALVLEPPSTQCAVRACLQRKRRAIALTKSSLSNHISSNASKDFRADLYYRLNVIHIPVPPLRDRREDVPGFLDHFLRSYAERHRVAIPTLTPARSWLLSSTAQVW